MATLLRSKKIQEYSVCALNGTLNTVEIYEKIYLTIILPAVRETSILLVVAKRVPKSQGNIHVIDYFPGTF